MQKTDSKNAPAFIADCHFGKLAKYLRFMGLDTLYFAHIDDNDLIALAKKEARVILTRDRALYERDKEDCVLLKELKIDKQLQEVCRRFDLQHFIRYSSRCIVCNQPLTVVKKEEIEESLPPKVIQCFSYFEQCEKCGRLYWHGDHYKRMKTFIKKVQASM